MHVTIAKKLVDYKFDQTLIKNPKREDENYCFTFIN